jgi:hypothetical protein
MVLKIVLHLATFVTQLGFLNNGIFENLNGSITIDCFLGTLGAATIPDSIVGTLGVATIYDSIVGTLGARK